MKSKTKKDTKKDTTARETFYSIIPEKEKKSLSFPFLSFLYLHSSFEKYRKINIQGLIIHSCENMQSLCKLFKHGFFALFISSFTVPLSI